jgi:hypothetical protein
MRTQIVEEGLVGEGRTGARRVLWVGRLNWRLNFLGGRVVAIREFSWIVGLMGRI